MPRTGAKRIIMKISPVYLLLIAVMGFFNPQTVFAASSSNADAEAVSDLPTDYSHFLSLTVSGKQGVVSLRLPQLVYLNAHSADLSDLRVFDANGGKPPFAFYVPAPQNSIQKQSWPVKQFEINAIQPNLQSVDGIDMDIKTGADGTLLSVKTKPRKGEAGSNGIGDKPVLVGLLLDLGQAKHVNNDNKQPLISALRFTLPPGKQTYSAQVWLEVSDNLKQWDMVAATELNWLVDTQTSETLVNDILEFSPRAFRYARLSWRSGEPIRFASIDAEHSEKTSTASFLDKLTIQPIAGKLPDDLMYKAGIAIPVEKIDLHFTEPNIVLPAQIGAYREIPSRQLGKPNEWVFQPLTRAVFYQITQPEKTRRSGELSVPVSHFAEWVLHPQVVTASKPELSLIWQPATLVFLINGPPPYTLAFGRDKIKSAAVELSQVAPGFSTQELLQLEQAQAGPLQIRQTSTDFETAATTAKNSAQNRTLILWGVLLLGVLVLLAMTWRLFKQMKS